MPLASLSIFKNSIGRADSGSASASDLAISLLEQVSKSPHVSECVVLSTCERVEIYMVAERFHGAMADARDALVRHLDADLTLMSDASVDRHDSGVVRHLFEVASGLDSKVLGETEILGQIGRAWDMARDGGFCRRVLNDLFRHAVVTGKRARSETAIGSGVRTIGSAALNLARPRPGENIFVVGTGDAAISAAHAAARSMPTDLVIAGRSLEKAEIIADQVGGRALDLSRIEESVVKADVVITATSNPEPLIGVSVLNAVANPPTLIDLGSPPNVAAEVDDVEGVTIFRLADVRVEMEGSATRRLTDVEDVELIVEEECGRYLHSVETRGVDPVVVDLRTKVENIRSSEIMRFSKRLNSLDVQQRQLVEELTGALAAKFVHAPISGLKSSAGTPDSQIMIDATRKLFDL